MNDVLATIARVRRLMPRNADVLAICEVAERALTGAPRDEPVSDITHSASDITKLASDVTHSTSDITRPCPVCEARRKSHAKAQARFRAAKAHTNGGGSPKEAVL
jgi:hypothetical protein